MTATWHLAPCLVRLRRTVDELWPDRDRRSDGALGDAAHAARTSEHNPDAKGCVHALDIDVDGVEPAAILAAVKHHPAAWYVIWDRHIYSRTHGWAKRAYTGSDPHTGHLHVSCLLTEQAENDTTPWRVEKTEQTMTITPAEMTAITESVFNKLRTTNVTNTTEVDPQLDNATLFEVGIVAARRANEALEAARALAPKVDALLALLQPTEPTEPTEPI